MEKATVLKAIIKKEGLTIRRVSAITGISYHTLLSILSNGVGRASSDNVLKICTLLGITVEELSIMAEKQITDVSELREYHMFNTVQSTKRNEKIEYWTDEEKADIEIFKEFLLSKRKCDNKKKISARVPKSL